MKPQQTLQARTHDQRIFTIACERLLAAGQAITTISSVAEDSGTLIATNPVINTAAVPLPDGTTAPIGTAIQVLLACVDPTSALDGAVGKLLTIRARFATSTDPAVEATVRLFLTDTPGASPGIF